MLHAGSIRKARGRRSPIKRSPAEKVFAVINICFLSLFCLITLYSFWYAMVLALNESKDSQLGGVWLWPRKFTFDNLRYVLEDPKLGVAYVNSVIRTAIGTFYSTVVMSLAAYFTSKRHLPGRNAILTFLMVPMFVTGSITTNYLVIAKLGLLDNFLVYILPAGFNVFYMVIIRSFFESLPASLEESAKIDGAGYFTIFFRIVLPLSSAAIATIALFMAVYFWLDFQVSIWYVTKKSLYVLPRLLYEIQQSTNAARDMGQRVAQNGGLIQTPVRISSSSVRYATLMVTTLPILLVYPFFQRYFAKGVMIGAIKE